MQGWTSSVSRGFHAKSRPHNLLHEWFSKFYCPINFSHYGVKGGYEMYKSNTKFDWLGKNVCPSNVALFIPHLIS